MRLFLLRSTHRTKILRRAGGDPTPPLTGALSFLRRAPRSNYPSRSMLHLQLKSQITLLRPNI